MAQNFFRLRPHTKISVGLGKQYGSVHRDYISRRQNESPALIAIHEWKIHKNASVVLLVEWRDGVGKSELLADLATLIEEKWEWDGVLVPREITLANSLRRDGQRPGLRARAQPDRDRATLRTPSRSTGTSVHEKNSE